ncbi:hypothetical protein ACEWY4_007694 [Coilia grayii]|uniref:Sterile alpha motif domain-containing protein 3 n=1 Tax=Coilia grayii TaxID=363190 RepID=A0ABD1K8T2_9TELE
MEDKWPVRVFVSDDDIRRISLDKKPSNVEALLSELKLKLALSYDFKIQYEDPVFNNALCNLTDVSELPERPTIKIVSCVVHTSPSRISTSLSTCSTEILSPGSRGDQRLRQDPWPAEFEIPEFSVDINYRLRQGDLAYMKDGSLLKMSRDMKHVILEKLAEAMYKYMAYPQDYHFGHVASALVKAHPCLSEPGSPTGYCAWKNSLKFKMGNYRTKLRRSGMADVSVNGNRRRTDFPDGDPSSSNIKRPKRSETNFLPNFPDGESAVSLEKIRIELEMEAKKHLPDVVSVKKMMDQTFSLRRREIVEEQPPVNVMVERWPALLTETQIYDEFSRVASRNLRQQFYEALDTNTPRLIQILKSKKGKVGVSLDGYLCQINSQNITATRTIVLRCLPLFFGDDDSEFYRTCFDSDAGEDFAQVPVGILTVIPEDDPNPAASLHLKPASIAVILEGNIVLDDLSTYPEAFCLLFGLMYALHLDYPKSMKYTFEFIQKILLNLGQNKLTPKLQTLKNALMSS